jgi:hypothetical protein
MNKRVLLSLFLTAWICSNISAQEKLMSVDENKTFHSSITHGIKLTPGQWRPNFGSEQIAWISPPWPSARPEYGQEFIYLDFPETIKIGNTLVYLSHVHPKFPALYNFNLEKVEWIKSGRNKISYERKLPNGLRFDGVVTITDSSFVELKIGITNETGEDLTDIRLQTCAFLNAIQEFDTPSDTNKYVYITGKGWTSFAGARTTTDDSGKYYFGWLGGLKNVELPFVVLRSNVAERYVVFSWREHSYSFVGNASHPCFHSDPWFPDLKNNSREEIRGFLWFYEGDLGSLEDALRKRFPELW